MRITISGTLSAAVTAKDLILFLISRLGTGAGTGYFIEYAGEAIRSLSMEGRMTVCNMAIEMGARGGLIAPDDTTFAYIAGREYAPKGAAWDIAVAEWQELKSDDGAIFDREETFDASEISPMITWGTNPGAGIPIDGVIPQGDTKALEYMGLASGDQLLGHPIDYVFVGSCTNGRIEDLREFASLVKGRRKADGVTAWIVPGSRMVEKQAIEEGIDKILTDAGFELRQPGCSACLAMNDDKVPAGKYCISTSNRNFEGRQGPGARTLLASPLAAAAAAVTGRITDPRTMR
jgi:3-isopropylmalate/(R)-2-methylmalate dehydratase large subunit